MQRIVISLTFQEVNFQRTMIASFTEQIISAPRLQLLAFIECGFHVYVFRALFESTENLKRLNYVEIREDQTEMTQSFIPTIINFKSLAEIKRINLSALSIDIAGFFISLENCQISLTDLDFPGNHCSKNHKRGVSLPQSIETLNLCDIRCAVPTSVIFLMFQPFYTSSTVRL
jgi:hypothetical protein